jgi:hypothetical protein
VVDGPVVVEPGRRGQGRVERVVGVVVGEDPPGAPVPASATQAEHLHQPQRLHQWPADGLQVRWSAAGPLMRALTHHPSAGLHHQQQRQLGDGRGEAVAPPSRCATVYHSVSGSQAKARPRAWPPATVPSGVPRKVADQIAQHHSSNTSSSPRGRVRQRAPAKPADRLDHGWTVEVARLGQRDASPSPTRASSQRSGASSSSAPGGTGTGSSGSLVQPPEQRLDQRPAGPTTAARPLTDPLGHHDRQPALPIQLRPGSGQVPAGDGLLGRAPALARQGAARHWRLQLQRRRREEGTCLPLAHHQPQVNHNGDPGRSGDYTPERSCTRRTSRKPSQPLRW